MLVLVRVSESGSGAPARAAVAREWAARGAALAARRGLSVGCALHRLSKRQYRLERTCQTLKALNGTKHAASAPRTP